MLPHGQLFGPETEAPHSYFDPLHGSFPGGWLAWQAESWAAARTAPGWAVRERADWPPKRLVYRNDWFHAGARGCEE
jgi:hypothetical protein